ncbi:MAG: SPOR domain-containing protein [Rhodospirillaceae bacterium]|nr:MAG: SPOR domain-containing protein [Rhodospirillaceae bacterium]
MAIDRDGDGPPLHRDEERAAKPAEGLRASPFTEDVFDDEYYGRRRRGGGISFGVIAGVVFVAAIVAAVGWYIVGERSASTGGEGGAGQVVKADPAPYKMKPDDPGGMQVDNQDKLIYDRVAKGAPPSRVENLLPAPEEPHAPPVQTTPAASSPPAPSAPPGASATAEKPAAATPPAASTDDSLAKLMAQLSASRGSASPQTAATPASQTLPANPPAVPDTGTPAVLAGPAAPGTTPAPAPDTKVVGVAPAAAAPAAHQPAPDPASPMLLVPVADSAAPSPPASETTIAQATAPAPASPAVAAPPAAQPPPATGGVSIQLASARSADAAMGEWKRINGKNSDLLTGLTPSVVQAEVPDKGTYFRLRAGPLADKPAAESLCGALAARNISCLVVRP